MVFHLPFVEKEGVMEIFLNKCLFATAGEVGSGVKSDTETASGICH